jgi:hypothetical protein
MEESKALGISSMPSTQPSLLSSLCNVIYKIITKLLVNWSKPIMAQINSQEQEGYIEGKQILDGIIIAHETIHSSITRKSLRMMIKHDMSKTYDRLSLEFMAKMLIAFGFS